MVEWYVDTQQVHLQHPVLCPAASIFRTSMVFGFFLSLREQLVGAHCSSFLGSRRACVVESQEEWVLYTDPHDMGSHGIESSPPRLRRAASCITTHAQHACRHIATFTAFSVVTRLPHTSLQEVVSARQFTRSLAETKLSLIYTVPALNVEEFRHDCWVLELYLLVSRYHFNNYSPS